MTILEDISMRASTFALLTLFPLLLAGAEPAPTLRVDGDLPQALTLTAEDLSKMPRAKAQTGEDDGVPVTYEGVALVDLLKRAGAPTGETLRGKALASYLVLKARDGYQVVLSLGEVDPAFGGQTVLVADHAEGKPLVSHMGPFRIVIPSDKRGARSVRMLTRIQLVRLRK